MKNETLYVTPAIEIIALESADIVTASFDGEEHSFFGAGEGSLL